MLQENVFKQLGIKILKNHQNFKFFLTAWQQSIIILWHNNKLTSEMCHFGVPTSVGPHCLIVPFVFHKSLLLHHHAAKLYWRVDFSNRHFPWAVLIEGGHGSKLRYIYTAPSGSYFFLESKHLSRPFSEVLNCAACNHKLMWQG